MYYKRKLAVYNLTVYAYPSPNGQCYVWNEANGNRGSCVDWYNPFVISSIITKPYNRGISNI